MKIESVFIVRLCTLLVHCSIQRYLQNGDLVTSHIINTFDWQRPILSQICLSFLHSQCTPAPGSTWTFVEHTCTSFRLHHHPYLNAHLTALHCPISFVYVAWKHWYEMDCFRYLSEILATTSLCTSSSVSLQRVSSSVPQSVCPVLCSRICLCEVCESCSQFLVYLSRQGYHITPSSHSKLGYYSIYSPYPVNFVPLLLIKTCYLN